jgi:hypothetical protein
MSATFGYVPSRLSGGLLNLTGFAQDSKNMFTIWFSEGGERLTERQWPFVPRVGEGVSLNDSTGRFDVIRVSWEEHGEATNGVAAHVSLRSVAS